MPASIKKHGTKHTIQRVRADPARSIDRLLVESPTGNYMPLFNPLWPNSGDPTASGAAYNPDCWAASLDFSGVVLGSTYVGNLGRGRPLNKRMLLTCEHGTHSIGDTLWWLDRYGGWHSRVVADAITNICRSPMLPENGFRVLWLDSDLPDSIPIIPLFDPALDGILSLVGVPLIAFQKRVAYGVYNPRVVECDLQDNRWFGWGAPTSALRLNYWASQESSSGAPLYALYGTRLVFVTGYVVTGGGAKFNLCWPSNRRCGQRAERDVFHELYRPTF